MRILLASALALSISAPSQGQEIGYQTMQMVEACELVLRDDGALTTMEFGAAAHCGGYLNGFYHMYVVANRLANGCFRPESYSATYIVKNLIKYVEDHPEKLDQHISTTLLELNEKLYTCPTEQPAATEQR